MRSRSRFRRKRMPLQSRNGTKPFSPRKSRRKRSNERCSAVRGSKTGRDASRLPRKRNRRITRSSVRRRNKRNEKGSGRFNWPENARQRKSKQEKLQSLQPKNRQSLALKARLRSQPIQSKEARAPSFPGKRQRFPTKRWQLS